MREAQRRPKTSKKYDVGMNATMYAIGPQFDLPHPRHRRVRSGAGGMRVWWW